MCRAPTSSAVFGGVQKKKKFVVGRTFTVYSLVALGSKHYVSCVQVPCSMPMTAAAVGMWQRLRILRRGLGTSASLTPGMEPWHQGSTCQIGSIQVCYHMQGCILTLCCSIFF